MNFIKAAYCSKWHVCVSVCPVKMWFPIVNILFSKKFSCILRAIGQLDKRTFVLKDKFQTHNLNYKLTLVLSKIFFKNWQFCQHFVINPKYFCKVVIWTYLIITNIYMPYIEKWFKNHHVFNAYKGALNGVHFKRQLGRFRFSLQAHINN